MEHRTGLSRGLVCLLVGALMLVPMLSPIAAAELGPRIAVPSPRFVDPSSPAYKQCLKALDNKKERDGSLLACADPDWGLKQMRVHEAHKLFADGRPGEGMWVGQVDTGYTRHPAIRDQLDLVNSANAMKPRDGAADAYSIGFLGWLTGGAFKNPLWRDPSHGTKTASLIVGDRNAPHDPQRSGWVEGAAPYVRFIPVRGSKGPALGPIGQRQAARAICYLAGGRVGSPEEGKKGACDAPNPNETAGLPLPPLARPVDVITMSRGGATESIFAYNGSLRRALAFARDRGVIVAAASGDYESLQTYPAHSCAVISVGSTLITGAPWHGSPHARAKEGQPLDACEKAGTFKIDISGPGAGVWRAAVDARPGLFQTNDPYGYGTGKGTSFTTPVVAAVAAMWRQYHRRIDPTRTTLPATISNVCDAVPIGVADDICGKYQPDLIPYVFSYVLRNAGFRTPKDVCQSAHDNQVAWGYDDTMVRTFCAVADKPWDTRYGAGILDAERVLAFDLPAADQVCSDIRRRGGELPKACSTTP